jgi:hypothetical protein
MKHSRELNQRRPWNLEAGFISRDEGVIERGREKAADLRLGQALGLACATERGGATPQFENPSSRERRSAGTGGIGGAGSGSDGNGSVGGGSDGTGLVIGCGPGQGSGGFGRSG